MKREGGPMEPYPNRLKLNPEVDEVAAEVEINVGEEDEVVAADEEIAGDKAGGKFREGERERGSMDLSDPRRLKINPEGDEVAVDEEIAAGEEEDEVLAADEEIAEDKDDSNKDSSDEEDEVLAAGGEIAVDNDETNGESSDNDDSNDGSSDDDDSNDDSSDDDDSSDEEDNEAEVLIQAQIERNLGFVTGGGRLAHFAVGALNRILLTRYREIRRQQRRQIIEYLLSLWGKEAAIFERLSSIYADIEHPQFVPRLEGLKKEDLLVCYLGTLRLVDERSGEKLIEKIKKAFSKLDRTQLRREWTALLRDSRMEFCLRLVEIFFLGSVANAAVRGCSSNLMAEVVLYRYVREGVDDPSVVNGNSRIIWLEVVGSLTVTYGMEQLGCHYLMDAIFREIFEIVCRGESVEAVHSLEKKLWCNPLSLRFTETREFLMLRLAKALGTIEEEKREVTRTIVFKMLNISQRDAGQKVDIAREVEHLSGIRSGAIVAKVIKGPKPKRRV